MPICNFCGREFPEVFECDKCHDKFCTYHLEPLMHDCSSIIGSPTTLPNQIPSLITPEQPIQQRSTYTPAVESAGIHDRGRTDGSFVWYHKESQIPENAFDPDSGITFSGILWQKKSELTHFIIGALLIYIIGFISFYRSELVESGLLWAIFILAFFYTTSFFFHELGHRQVARHYKMQTKFRLLTYGMTLTAFSLVMGIFSLTSGMIFPSLALPGAVVVLGLEEISHRTGVCKMAGPLVNLIYGLILFVSSLIIPIYPLNMLIAIAAFFNAQLGLFNLIPIGILDGANIIKWKKEVWIFLVVALGIMAIVTYSLVWVPDLHIQYFIREG
jgi:Zn-dependent protease